ncbi:MAG: protein tyrosine phosphatase family protein [Pseudomonadota bacterium]
MNEPTHILNWRRINERITTSGQPNETQMAEIKALGVSHIVNLGVHHQGTGALADEPATVAELGMEYIYIPVDFEHPTDTDFAAFEEALAAHPDATIHVHCIYNARVSAFFYRYAKNRPDLSEAEAFDRMESIWRPGDDWARFIDSPAAEGQPNRYAGEDY